MMNCRQNDYPPAKASDKLVSRQKANRQKANRQDSGQIVVEYVLLLVIAVSIATLITRTMISQSGGNQGFIITTWQSVLTAIGSDKADDVSAPSK